MSRERRYHFWGFKDFTNLLEIWRSYHVCNKRCVFKTNMLGKGLPLAWNIQTSHDTLRVGPRDNITSLPLTHSGRVTHIFVNKVFIIGSDNGLTACRRQEIIWPNAGMLLIWALSTYVIEILVGIHTLSFIKMHLKMSPGKSRPFCRGHNVLLHIYFGLTCGEVMHMVRKHMEVLFLVHTISLVLKSKVHAGKHSRLHLFQTVKYSSPQNIQRIML